MLYFNVIDGKVTEIATQLTTEQHRDRNWVCRSDIDTKDEAQAIATSATELTGDLHIVSDRPNCYPRFDVIRAPKIGDEVSYSFNGDTYPCGTITKISKTLKRITTSEGHTFNRVKDTGRWLNNGCWSLVAGHVRTWNREF